MRDKLIQYIDLLFAGTPDCEDIKQEILQNTLDRYDDLIAQGKSPEAAYSLSITGIGDIQEVLNHSPASAKPVTVEQTASAQVPPKKRSAKIMTAIAIALFVLCPIPVILLGNTLGICLLFVMIAAGVALLIINGSGDNSDTPKKDTRSPLHKTLHSITWVGGLCLYFAVSFITGAWYITWLIFPIISCTCGLISACFDLNKVFLNAVLRIVIFSILILVLIVSLLGTCLGVSAFSYFTDKHQHVEGTVASSGSVSADKVNDIEIQWVGGSITVEPGNVQDIQFSENSGLSDDDRMVWELSGDRLIIQFCNTKLSFSIFENISIPSKNLVITVPQDWYCDELEINSVSAQINVSHLAAREADIVNVSGVCRIFDCNFNDFNGETISGNVTFNGQAATADLSSVSANCIATFTAIPRELDLETVSGDMTLVLPADCGFTLRLDSVSGELISDFATTVKNDRYFSGNGAFEITADTVSGDIRIQKPE